MVKKELIKVEKHITAHELSRRIKRLEKDTMVLQRLYFIKYRYEGNSVESASALVGITKCTGYHWQERWNKDGYEGLIPKFAGGKPSQLTNEQKVELREILEGGDNWTTKGVRMLISKKFGVLFSEKHVREILKGYGMRHAKPYQHDYRKPADAIAILKKGSRNRKTMT